MSISVTPVADHPSIMVLSFSEFVSEKEILDLNDQMTGPLLAKAEGKIDFIVVWEASNTPISMRIIMASAQQITNPHFGRLVIVTKGNYMKAWAQTLQGLTNKFFSFANSKEEAITSLETKNQESS